MLMNTVIVERCIWYDLLYMEKFIYLYFICIILEKGDWKDVTRLSILATSGEYTGGERIEYEEGLQHFVGIIF